MYVPHVSGDVPVGADTAGDSIGADTSGDSIRGGTSEDAPP